MAVSVSGSAKIVSAISGCQGLRNGSFPYLVRPKIVSGFVSGKIVIFQGRIWLYQVYPVFSWRVKNRIELLAPYAM